MVFRPRDLASRMAGRRKPDDGYLRETFTLPRDKARAKARDFLSRYPDDPLADNARYWLGESYYARGDYPRAAETFFEAYEKNKTGPKAPDTLLKLGMALGNLDKKKEACASFRELSRAFPNAAAPIKDKAAQESRRLGCG